MKNKIIILTLFLGLFGCIGTNIPKTEKRAKKRLSKHLKGIQNIANTYPDLLDTFRLVLHDTITIEKHDIDTTYLMEHDTVEIDKILTEFLVSDERQPRTKQRIRTFRNKIIQEVLKDTTFFYEDSLIASTFIIKDGKFYYKSTVKEQKEAFVTNVVNQIETDCEIKKDFWLDLKFWGLLLILLIFGVLRDKVFK